MTPERHWHVLIAATSVLLTQHAGLAQPAETPAPASAAAPASADPSRPKRAWRLEVSGDLVCSSLASRLTSELKRAAAAKAEVVIVQLAATRWRSDVVLAVSEAMRSTSLPIHVILNAGAGERVGLGAVLIGLNGASVWLTPGTKMVGLPTDRVPATATTVKASKVENAAMAEALDAALARRAAPIELGPLLLTPTGPHWLVVNEQGPRIVDDITGRSETAAVFSNEVDGVHVQFTQENALAARLIDGVRGGDSLFRHMGFLPARPRPESALRDEHAFTPDSTLKCDPEADYKDVCSAFNASDAALDRASKLLDPPGDGKPTSHAKAEAGRQLGMAKQTVEELERTLKAAPELMERPVPGQTEVGVKASGWPAKWRNAIQKRRDQINKLMARTK